MVGRILRLRHHFGEASVPAPSVRPTGTDGHVAPAGAMGAAHDGATTLRCHAAAVSVAPTGSAARSLEPLRSGPTGREGALAGPTTRIDHVAQPTAPK